MPDIVAQIHKTPTKAVLIVTGGGTGVFGTLLRRGGGSATLLSGLIPYGQTETIELLGGTPDKFVSELTTRQMAMAAYQRALKLRDGDYPVIGVACSSALQKTPTEREGRTHVIYAALQTSSKSTSIRLEIEPDHIIRTGGVGSLLIEKQPSFIRQVEEEINDSLLLNLIAEGCGLTTRSLYGYDIECGQILRHESHLTSEHLPGLLDGTVPALAFDCHKNGQIEAVYRNRPNNAAIFPGSFNPYHAGHEEMCSIAVHDVLHKDMEYEISIRNVDKPPLDFRTLEERLQQFCWDTHGHGAVRVWVTNAPHFSEKAKLFPGATFVIGHDTATRIIDPKYTGSVESAINVFEKYNCKFLVFGREVDGVYSSDLQGFPDRFKSISTVVEKPLVNRAVSSTDIRRHGK